MIVRPNWIERKKQAKVVTEDYLRSFKAGDLVDVREVRRKHGWTGPHKILVYKIEAPARDTRLAAYLVVDLGKGNKLGVGL